MHVDPPHDMPCRPVSDDWPAQRLVKYFLLLYMDELHSISGHRDRADPDPFLIGERINFLIDEVLIVVSVVEPSCAN